VLHAILQTALMRLQQGVLPVIDTVLATLPGRWRVLSALQMCSFKQVAVTWFLGSIEISFCM
jgi:hypothetical protein